jgi:hypothetical protein
MQWFISLIILLPIVTWLVLRWIVRAEPRQIMRVLRWLGLAVAVVLAGFAARTGHLGLIIAAAAILIPLIARWRVLQNIFKAARGPTPGKGSEVRTRFVLMRLDHDTGEMDGTVSEGPHSGRALSSLSFHEVLEVYQASAADPQSAQVMQAYLERMHSDAWQAHTAAAGGASQGPGPSPGGGPMSAEEARGILGVGRDADPTAIKQAHRRLMKQVHPDHGGSDYLAARINEAKEVLLEE